MEYPIHKGFTVFLRKIDITAHKRILITQFSDFSICCLAPILFHEHNLSWHLRLANRTGLIRSVYLKYSHGKSAFAAGIYIEDLYFFIVEIIRRFTSYQNQSKKWTGLVAKHPHIRWRKECNRYSVCQEKFGKRYSIFGY